jgi:sugar lactone lactonase YvrE
MSGPSRPVRTLVGGLNFPEAPRWHDGALWFSDIHGHRVYRLGAGDTPVVVAQLDDRVSGLGFLPPLADQGGDALVVSMLDRKLVAIAPNGETRVHADLSHLSRGFINDMVVDRNGRAYVGSRNGGDPASASDSLLFVDRDGSARTIVESMVSPNGAVITPDGRHLIIAETAAGRLLRFSIAADGSLSERIVLTELPGRHFDGICRDAEGGIWAGGGIGGLLRIAQDGSLAEAIDFPGRMVLACSLGGPDGRTLFLATTGITLLDNLAWIGADRTRDARVNSAGRIEAMAVEVPAQAS